MSILKDSTAGNHTHKANKKVKYLPNLYHKTFPLFQKYYMGYNINIY